MNVEDDFNAKAQRTQSKEFVEQKQREQMSAGFYSL
jgi:hypothetical protein